MAKNKQPEVFMPELLPAERLEYMRNNCEKEEKRKYYVKLTPAELKQRNSKFVRNHGDLLQLDADLSAIKKEFKGKAEPIKAENVLLMTEINTEQREVEGNIFHIADWDTNKMVTYNDQGEEIGRRSLYPDEKQKRASFPLRKVVGGEDEGGAHVIDNDDDDDD